MSESNSSTQEGSNDFFQVLKEELDAFGIERMNDGGSVLQRAHDSRLAGLAFSGGGIRSATFNLGVLQALADLNLLRKFHYLSTVSGGGYIGSWLVAWIHRRRGRLDEVARALRTEWKIQPTAEGPEEIRFLRRFSNYLTPKLGWFGADTWTVLAIYLRNVLLNLAALIAALAFVLMLPRVFGVLIHSIHGTQWSSGIFLFSLVVAGLFVTLNWIFFKRQPRDDLAGDPLGPSRRDVRELDLPAPGLGQEFFFADGEEFSDFLLEIQFTLEETRSGIDLLLRVPTGDSPARGWEIAIGRGRTGRIGRKPARGVELEPPGSGRLNRLRVLCLGHTCTVRLNGEVVNVLRSPSGVPDSGRIGLRGRAHGDGLELTKASLRTITKKSPWYTRQGLGIQLAIVLPLLFAGVLSLGLLGAGQPIVGPFSLPPSWRWFDDWQWLGWGVLTAGITFLLHIIELGYLAFTKGFGLRQIWSAIWGVISGFIGGAVGGLVLVWFHRAILPGGTENNFWPRLVWGPPMFLIAFSTMLILYIGLRGRHLWEPWREWWSRLGAWLLIYSMLWIGLFGLALYSPPLLGWLVANAKKTFATLTFAWVFSTFAGLLAAASPKTGKRSSNPWAERLAAVAPYVFIVGLLAALACGVDAVIKDHPPPPPSSATTDVSATSSLGVKLTVEGAERPPIELKITPAPSDQTGFKERRHAHWNALTVAHLQDGAQNRNRLLLILLGATLAVVLLYGWCIDINEFSMHMMYRNRLARCYLGASNTAVRNPHVFTGFDPNDDFDLAALQPRATNAAEKRKPEPDWEKERRGPYPIINCALNLVGGDELAWQQRKAASFVYTPLYSGYDFPDLPPGYCRLPASPGRKNKSISLATAMTVSGAAASPNMGYHTSPAPAFLMTLFNVRLGWWAGNPRHPIGRGRASPLWSVGRLAAEMFGLTDAHGRYIYLSDGGHFENLGIYELVRRRCRFIVACDAEDDHNFEFGGLGNAIEKCRTDLGIEIELDVEAIRRRDELRHSRWHCAVGQIRYDKTDPGAHAGTILYIKSSLTGDEPTDVQRYAATNPPFPHETTADQWFGESQFESYRALGHHATTSAFQAVDDPENLSGLTTERLFVDLAQRWYAPCTPLDPSFGRRGETLNALYETLRREPNLSFLSQQIYPEWRTLVYGRREAPPLPIPPGHWLPESYDEVGAGLYFCNRMIQLMEDVYHDLHLEQEFTHPDNRGWINLFKHWAWSRMFRVAWTISAANSGARFQNFCQRVLDLRVGDVVVVQPTWSPQPPRGIAGFLCAKRRASPLGLREITTTQRRPEAFLLTSVEKELLRFAGDLRGCSIRLVQVIPDSSSTEAPAFVAGIVLLRERPGRSPAIRYFRIRDHLRRMGMGRRGLFALLDNDMWNRRASDELELIGLDLLPPPLRPAEIEDEDSRQLFLDLYRGVQFELESVKRTIALAEGVIRAPEERLRALWADRGSQVHQGDEIPSLLNNLRTEGDCIRGDWLFEDGRRSEVVARFQPVATGTEVRVMHRFLSNRDVRDAMERRWTRTLWRLASESDA
ncbi:MAG TPA: patatin-like phospholipase family protein [Chthoniobacterales bacterium]|nr:patatin-like phospholipase family protein [Chthoniobacterales bacterium]